MTESKDPVYKLNGIPFENDNGKVFPPFYSSRSDELWSNQYLEELRGKHSRPGRGRLDLLDVGTGSGITAIHWLKLMPAEIQSVTMTDNNRYAIDCAKRNIDAHFRKQVTWTIKRRGKRYEGKLADGTTTDGIQIIIEKSSHDRVWPEKKLRYDYIVFNGPHLDKSRKDLLRELKRETQSANKDRGNIRKQFGDGLLSGICDPGLKANTSFVQNLFSYLKVDGYAILTFSDYSIPSEGEDPLEMLLRQARRNQLTATFLSVSEFCPGEALVSLSRVKDIPKRKIMLWKNVVFRRVYISKKSELEKKFNLHKTASGFIAAASQIADIYCTKEPTTHELYKEMANRMQAFYRMFCEQVGLASGFENHFVLSGFSLPKVAEAFSWIYGEKLYDYKERIEQQIRFDSNHDSSTGSSSSIQRNMILQNTNIYRLEVRANLTSSHREGYIDRNIAMNEDVSQPLIGMNSNGGRDQSHLQVRYRIQLPFIESPDEIASSLNILLKDLNKKDQDLIKQILTDIISKLSKEVRLPEDEKCNNNKKLAYCLHQRYSGSVNKSAVFSLFSSTEDLPFLPLLRSFGRIANTAANNMLTSLIAYEAARKAARAAVFARNFSHITGSHVISNPQFSHSLAGDGLVKSYRKALNKNYDNFLAAENNLLKRYLDNPAHARKLWSDATKVLAETRDMVRTGDVMLKNTRLFHEYLQGRFDFIARAIDDTKDQPEPVRFVKDLLDGFLLQTAYLDNLVADVGLRLEIMEFWVQIKRSRDKEFKKFKAKLKPRSSGDQLAPAARDQENEIVWEEYSSTNDGRQGLSSIEHVDVLVGLPGGSIAAHAFYSLLENIIRNSAKYGKGNQNTSQTPGQKNVYRLTVSLEYTDPNSPSHISYDNPYYLVQIYDNYSLASTPKDKKDKRPWEYLQQKLENGFVKDNGEPQTEGLGMLEMQACAQLLCNPNESKYPGTRPPHVSGGAQEIAKTLNLWTTGFRPDIKTPDNQPLIYNLTLNMPILLGCLTDPDKRPEMDLMFYSSDLKRMSDRSPFLLVVDGNWLKSEDRFERFAKQRDSLPYRILILDQESTNTNQSDHEACHDQNLRGAKRIHDTKLLPRVLRNTTRKDQNDDPMEIFLAAYQAWLRAWKRQPDNKPWHLWIGLERQAKQVEAAWQHAEQSLDGDKDLLRLMVQSYSPGETGFATKSIIEVYSAVPQDLNSSHASDGTTGEEYWNRESKQPRSEKKALLFDNHGNCFPEAYALGKATSLKLSTRFYQKLSGTVSPELFRMLSRPPKEEFLFRFFIYSLLEACLTDVGVVDERLAWSLVEGAGSDDANDRFAEDLLEHQQAGIFPIFRFRHEGAGEEVGHYTLVHKERLEKSMRLGHAHPSDQANQNPLLREGITFNRDDELCSKIALATPDENDGALGSFKLLDEIKPDVILIHEGAMDILTAQQVDWSDFTDGPPCEAKKQLQALYTLTPMIIRTSGRGRKSSWLGEHLPFIEFGQVSSGLLTARNKFSLVRGLLGSVGRTLEQD